MLLTSHSCVRFFLRFIFFWNLSLGLGWKNTNKKSLWQKFKFIKLIATAQGNENFDSLSGICRLSNKIKIYARCNHQHKLSTKLWWRVLYKKFKISMGCHTKITENENFGKFFYSYAAVRTDRVLESIPLASTNWALIRGIVFPN